MEDVVDWMLEITIYNLQNWLVWHVKNDEGVEGLHKNIEQHMQQGRRFLTSFKPIFLKFSYLLGNEFVWKLLM